MSNVLRSRLWVRLALAFSVISLLPIIGAGLLTAQLLSASMEKDVTRRQSALAAMGSRLVRDYIELADEKLTTVSRLLAHELGQKIPGVGESSKAAQQLRDAVVQRLNRLVEPPDMYLELEFYSGSVDREAKFVGRAQQLAVVETQSSIPELADQQVAQVQSNLANPVVQQPLLENRNFVADQLETVWGFPALQLSAPVAKSQEEPVGALVAYLDFRRVNDLLQAVAEDGYEVRLRDGGGNLLAAAGTVPGEAVNATVPAGFSDWSLEVKEPASPLRAATRQVRQQILLWTGVALVLALGVSLAVSRRIVRPVTQLTDAARAMEGGALATRANITRADEIGRLAAAFDRMASSLQELDQAKSEFVANASHELRTPLTAMRLSIANLLDGVVGEIEPRPRETLERLRGDVDRLIRLVNDLLDLARLESGAVRPQHGPCDLAATAAECVAQFEPLAGEKGIHLTTKGVGVSRTDRSLLQRVLSNLLENAIRFTPEGGEVTVTVADNCVEVSDTGPGVDSSRVFEKFVQGEQHGVKNEGAGLGLAIVEQLVRTLGGDVRLEESDESAGATFTVKLPDLQETAEGISNP